VGIFNKTKEEIGDKLTEGWYGNRDLEEILNKEVAEIEKKKEAKVEHIRFLVVKHFQNFLSGFIDTLFYLLLIGVLYIIGLAIWQIIKLFY